MPSILVEILLKQVLRQAYECLRFIWEERSRYEGVGKVRREGGKVSKGYFNEKMTAIVNKSCIPLRNQQGHGLELPTEEKGYLCIYPLVPIPHMLKVALESHPGQPTLA